MCSSDLAAAGWPLMIAAVAADDADVFDALSRSFGYVLHRPASYAGYVLLAWAQGLVGLVVVAALARGVVHMAAWGLAFGGPDGRIASFYQLGGAGGSAALVAHAAWVGLVELLAFAWVYSYAWSAATIIYLLLRRDVDGTDWREIADPPRDGQEPFSGVVKVEPARVNHPSVRQTTG